MVGGVVRGANTRTGTPARAAYAAAATPALPAVGSTKRSAPAATARVTAALSPRALNEPVGLAPSSFTHRSCKPKPGARPSEMQQRRVAFAEGDRLFAREQRQERAEAPHAVPPPNLRAIDQGRGASGVADQPGQPACVAHRGQPFGSPGGAAVRALEDPVRRAGRGHVARCRCDRIRSASRVENPGTAASSVTEADFTPARLPNRSSSSRRRLGPTPGMLSSSDVMVRERAPGPVIGQPEPVRLVARALEQPEGGAAAGEAEAVGPMREEDLLLPLGEAHHGNRRPARPSPWRRARR